MCRLGTSLSQIWALEDRYWAEFMITARPILHLQLAGGKNMRLSHPFTIARPPSCKGNRMSVYTPPKKYPSFCRPKWPIWCHAMNRVMAQRRVKLGGEGAIWRLLTHCQMSTEMWPTADWFSDGHTGVNEPSKTREKIRKRHLRTACKRYFNKKNGCKNSHDQYKYKLIWDQHLRLEASRRSSWFWAHSLLHSESPAPSNVSHPPVSVFRMRSQLASGGPGIQPSLLGYPHLESQLHRLFRSSVDPWWAYAYSYILIVWIFITVFY